MSNIDIELYSQKQEINTNPPEIIIEIAGLKSLNKFIGLDDTPTYYENGKFFKVVNNKIVYTDITWEDIKGDIEKNPELQQEVLRLVEINAKKYTEEAVNTAIDVHNKNENAHPYIQNIIEQNHEKLTNKIELNRIDTNQKIDEANSKIDTNKSNIDRLDTFTQEINTNLENLTLEVNVDIKGDISKLQDDLQTTNQEIVDNFTILDTKIDNTKSELNTTISDNYTTLDTKIDNTKSELNTTVSDNYTTIDTKIDNVKNELNTTVSDNYTTLDTKIDNTKSELNITVSYNYTILDTKINNTKSELNTTISDNYTTLDNKINENYNNLDLRISTNTQDIADLTQVVEDDFQEVNTHITDLNTRVTNNTNNITTLDTKIDNVNNASIKDIAYDKTTQKFTITFGNATTKDLTLEELITGASYDGDTGNFTFTKANGESVVINTPKENFLSNVQYNSETKKITFTMSSGTAFEVNISDLIDVYTVNSTNSINMNITESGEITSSIKLSADEDNIISIETDGLLAKHQDISYLATKSEIQTGLNNKVDKEDGKVLISQIELNRLASVYNYDDTQIKSDISTLQNNKQDTLTAGEGIKIDNNTISTESTKILTDNETIIQNDDNTITAIGTQTKSNTNLYNWVGTNEQYETDVLSGTITSETQCIITDDEQDFVEYIPIATNNNVGLVKPDGTTITITSDGTISSNQQDLALYLTKNEASTTYETIENSMSIQEELQGNIDTKQDIINDLEDIRSGANKGSTSVQFDDLATVATSGSYTDLSNKPTIPTVTDTYSATSTDAMSGVAVDSAISNKMDKVTLATVATSGSYTDLIDKPTIPTTTNSVTSDSTEALTSGGAYTALVEKQDVTDNTLTTTAKTITGAINELNSSLGDISTALDNIING